MMPREFFPERPSLPWQQNLGHNELELGLGKRYRRSLHQMVCFQDRFILVWAVRNYSKRTYAPPQKSNVKYTKNRYYLATKKHFYIF